MGFRAPLAVIWKEVFALGTGDTITRENTWRDGINRAADIGYGALSALFSFRAALGSQAAGTRAVIRSPVLLTELSYYDAPAVPVGALDGLTLFLEDSGIAITASVAFVAPTSPADVIAQINAVAIPKGVQAEFDNGWDEATSSFTAANVGKLKLQSLTPGATTLTVKGTGTANGVLGFPGVDTTALGTADVSDGTTQIGVAAIGSLISAGTLRDALIALEENVNSLRRRPNFAALSNTSSNVDRSLSRTWTIPVFAGASVTYTLTTTTGTAPTQGDTVRIVSRGLNDGVDLVYIASEGVGNVFEFTAGDSYGWVDMQYESTADGGNGAWVVTAWYVDGGNYALVDPYPA